ncbi:hypothetical protein DA01_08485 [Dehalococcoides mccartyi]|uniref:DZANK-type domain-containing protein n=1 Tax=Dehalococcoides mccartyi TaxID=61435 RepID=A0A0V8LX65_9CHLR|nr:hypothetical protein [Dehalococcoides mccartyi]KSV16109.1 hypothetical protein DA01_08485 [Dehalococcoides mccartyi]
MTHSNSAKNSTACPYCDIATEAEARMPFCKACKLSLFYCPACGGLVGRGEAFCPHCQAEMTGQKEK